MEKTVKWEKNHFTEQNGTITHDGTEEVERRNRNCLLIVEVNFRYLRRRGQQHAIWRLDYRVR